MSIAPALRSQMQGDLTVDQVRLMLANLCNIGGEGLVTVPNCAACCARCATLALQISFLLSRQVVLGKRARLPPAPHNGRGRR
ncbi:hypothetical protein SAMN05443247_05047 [Bradyrhizobium erythrophlei]|jgi:hypothetical protein|nr:hypothetical protein SAMN05443247_05047 [Bradyrhizobium erythrophlei]